MFITFWTLGKNIDQTDIAEAAAEMMEKGTFPTDGVDVKEWLLCPGGRGITILEAENEKAAFRSYSVWAKAIPGFFDSYELMPAVQISDAIAIAME